MTKAYNRLQRLAILVWKWEHIFMDLITKLQKTNKCRSYLGQIINKLTNIAYFIVIHESSSSEKVANICVKGLIVRHGVPILEVLDRDIIFTSRFWSRF